MLKNFNRQLQAICVVIGVMTSGFILAEPAAVNGKVYSVTMKSLSYDPKKIEIKVGESVQWVNKSLTEHSATTEGTDPVVDQFDTKLVQPNKTSKQIKFTKPGVYIYHCAVHGKTMSGQIVVTQ